MTEKNFCKNCGIEIKKTEVERVYAFSDVFEAYFCTQRCAEEYHRRLPLWAG